MPAPSAKINGGRPARTTHERIADVALELFARQGFERTTVDEIASAVGVGRRTIFRYFPSKNDMLWADFDRVLEHFRATLAASDPELSAVAAVGRAVLASNRFDAEQLSGVRIRTTLITRAPVLQGHAMIRYTAWRRVVAEFAAQRFGCRYDDLVPQALAQAALGATIAAFTRWVRTPDEDLERCLADAFDALATGFAPPP